MLGWSRAPPPLATRTMSSAPHPSRSTLRAPSRAAPLALAALLVACGGGGGGGGKKKVAAPGTAVGETPAVPVHLVQGDIDSGALSVAQVVEHGALLFAARFNALDGAGRPGSTGTGAPRPFESTPHNVNRISGPEAGACAECHKQPFVGASGGHSRNVWVLADALPFVNFDEGAGDGFQQHDLRTVGLERGTVGMFGAGFVEMLAREMSQELQALRAAASSQAVRTGLDVPQALVTKGVSFGALVAKPDGTVDMSGVEGVDSDLVVKPFHQKGVVASLRQFTNTALNQHHGMQSAERFGPGTDADGDGVLDEITPGDVTALTLFQASLPAPGRVLPTPGGAPGPSPAVDAGAALFEQVGCVACHKPTLRLVEPVFTEPGPYHGPGELQLDDVPQPVALDLLRDGPGPWPRAEADGSVLVPAYTDLKRHDMGPLLADEGPEQGGVPRAVFLTKKLWGLASQPPYLHHGRALTLDEAILAHGGEAQAARDGYAALTGEQRDLVVEFLLSLRLVPPGGNATTIHVPDDGVRGDRPAVKEHLAQADVDAGLYSNEDLFDVGSALFDTSFNTLDGAGRPETTGDGLPRPRRDFPDNVNRFSGPDSTGCVACHVFPRGTAGGGVVGNVFVGAEAYPFVQFDGGAGDLFRELHLDTLANERATVGLHGAGYLELVAREMTAALHALRDQALADAHAGDADVTVPLVAKGVAFGALTARPDGTLDTLDVEGVDGDLVVKPFHQKGVSVSLRDFTNFALNQHHGIQSSERFGVGADPDGDGLADELTVGDVTALAVYQAMQAAPGRLLPSDPERLEAVDAGEATFLEIGCATCHVPELVLDDPTFTEPGPYNPPGNLHPDDVPAPVSIDLSTEGRLPRLPEEPDGTVRVPAYTDLKRHDMGPALADPLVERGVAPELFLTKRLWGAANEPPYMHHGRASTLREAVLLHGGEAQAARDAFAALPAPRQDRVIDFLNTLRLLPKDSPLVVFQ